MTEHIKLEVERAYELGADLCDRVERAISILCGETPRAELGRPALRVINGGLSARGVRDVDSMIDGEA